MPTILSLFFPFRERFEIWLRKFPLFARRNIPWEVQLLWPRRKNKALTRNNHLWNHGFFRTKLLNLCHIPSWPFSSFICQKKHKLLLQAEIFLGSNTDNASPCRASRKHLDWLKGRDVLNHPPQRDDFFKVLSDRRIVTLWPLNSFLWQFPECPLPEIFLPLFYPHQKALIRDPFTSGEASKMQGIKSYMWSHSLGNLSSKIQPHTKRIHRQ